MPSKVEIKKDERYGICRIVEELAPVFDETCNRFNRCFKCICDCGNIFSTLLKNLRSKGTKSCGCLHLLQASQQGKANVKHGYARRGKERTKIYTIWQGIHRRCYRKNSSDYARYGARGITVCARWHRDNPNGFLNFLNDMKEPPENHSIERIHNDGEYSPSNCKWATKKEQANNTRNNRIIIYQKKEYTLAQLSETINIPYNKLRHKLGNLNCGIEEIVEKLVKNDAFKI
jgi:hypothetical protein